MSQRAQNFRSRASLAFLIAWLSFAGVWSLVRAQHPGPAVGEEQYPMPSELQEVDLVDEAAEVAVPKSAGCVHCHEQTYDPHYKDSLHLGCCDCHGGDPGAEIKEKAHVAPRFPDAWTSSANPVRSYTLLNHE